MRKLTGPGHRDGEEAGDEDPRERLAQDVDQREQDRRRRRGCGRSSAPAAGPAGSERHAGESGRGALPRPSFSRRRIAPAPATPPAGASALSRYAAFLRAINVGGRRISSADLRAHVEALGFEDVACFRASGNVVLGESGRAAPAKVTQRLEQGLEEALGYEVPVFLRTADEVLAMAAHQPFDPAVVEASKGKLQVALLLKKPSAAARERVLALSSDEDRLAFEGRELYWLPSGGMLDSELDMKTIGKAVGATTMRTKGTVEAIATKFFG